MADECVLDSLEDRIMGMLSGRSRGRAVVTLPD